MSSVAAAQEGASHGHGRSGEDFRVPEYQELVLMNDDYNNRRRNKLGDNPIVNTAQDPDIQQDINRLLSPSTLFIGSPSENGSGRSRRPAAQGGNGISHASGGSKRKETDEQQDADEFNPNKKKAKTAKKIQKRITNACDTCKHGHLKCDGNTPCNNCRAHNKKCLYSLNKKRGPKKKDERQKQQNNSNLNSSNSNSNSSNSNHTSPPLEFSYDNECTPPAKSPGTAPNCYADSSSALVVSQHQHHTSSSASDAGHNDANTNGKSGQQTVAQLLRLNDRLMHDLQEKEQTIAALTHKYEDLQHKYSESVSQGGTAQWGRKTPLIDALRANEYSCLAIATNWVKLFHEQIHALWDMLEMPDQPTIREALRPESPLRKTKRFLVFAVLSMGASVAGNRDYCDELTYLTTQMIDDDILEEVDSDLIFGLLIISKIMLSFLRFPKGAFYGQLAHRAMSFLPQTNVRLHIKVLAEAIHLCKDTKDRNYLFQKALSLRPKGYDLILLFSFYIFNDVCRPIVNHAEEWSSTVLFPYIDEAEETLRSVGGTYVPGRAIAPFNLTLQLLLWSFKAITYSRLQKMDMALSWADKIISVLDGGDSISLGGVYAILFAANIHLKYRKMEMLRKEVKILHTYSRNFYFAEHSMKYLMKAVNSTSPYDDRTGSLSFIPEYAQYFLSDSMSTAQSTTSSPSVAIAQNTSYYSAEFGQALSAIAQPSPTSFESVANGGSFLSNSPTSIRSYHEAGSDPSTMEDVERFLYT